MIAIRVSDESCGYDATFDFDALTGLLTIKGEGKMWDYADCTPWVYGGYNDKIKNVVIEEGITYICEYAFAECTNLETVQLPSTITKIGKCAFLNCSSLKGSVSISASTEEIALDAFWGCSSLEAINVHEDNEIYKSIDGVLFEIFGSRDGIVYYPPGKTETSYAIPYGFREIYPGAFACNQNLKEVTIPENNGSNVYIEEKAFIHCESLEKITLPLSLSLIAKNAFMGCNNLEHVYYAGTEGQWNGKSIAIGNECLENATIHFGNGVVYEDYSNSVSFYVDKAYDDAQILFTEYDEDGKLISFKLVKADLVEDENVIESEKFTLTGSQSLLRIMAFESNSVSPIFNRKYEMKVSN